MGDYLDDSYFVPMGIGTPAQTLNVLPDTGSTNLWVIDSTCTDEKNCPSSSPKFTASMSKTHQGSRTPFHEVYGDHAAASGTISQDTVSLAGYSISPLAFGRVRHVTKRTMGPTVSGILGLSFHDPKLDDLEPFWQVLYERQEMQDYVFSFQLPKALVYAKPDREEDALTSGGVFTLGVLDPQQYAGSISWSPLSRGYGMHAKKSWTIDVNEMRLNGHSVDLGPHRHALIDTGSSNIVGPRQAMDILHALIPGAQRFPPNPEYYMLPCNSSIQLDITFSDRTWTLPPDHLIMQKINQTMCLSALTTVEDTSDIPLGWIMGHPFLTHVFSVFDAKEERIGFASLPQGGVQNATLTQADIDPQGLKVPMYYDRRALHPRNQNMNQDQLDEWLRMQSKNMHWRYTHPDDRNSSDALEKRQQLGMGDYGLDSFYFAPIGIGTPEMTLNVVLDTGSADFWLADSQCSPMKHCPESMLKYDASKSRTHKDLHVPFGVQYGSGAVRGELATEKVSLAGYTVSSVSFGQADQLARGTINPPASGIMGMGYESLSTTGTMPFWQILLERQKLHDYLFTFQMVNNLKKASSGRVDMVEAGGVFTLGVLDDQQYSGDIAWAPMARGYGSKGVGYWALNLEDLSVNGEHIDLGTHSVAAIDTGTTLIGGPKLAMDRIHAKIPGAQRYNRVPEYYVFPCDTDAKVDLTFGNHTWTLKTEDLISQRLSRRVCLSSLFAMSTRSGSRMPAWIVGDTFLKTVFSVFDAGKNRIGFASLPKGGAQTKSITSATMDNRVASSYQQTASSEGSPFGGGGGGGGGDGGGGGIIITRTRNVDESWKTASIDVPHNVQPLHAPKWNEAASLGVSQLVVPMLLIASAALFL
ncbi:Cathepsin D [Malassezia restricta CBS 7877]|uniref:Cathepsin D n=1 Tax=Malassezia restricta (strain ATCC 96810 / NBRC 103918 / CBS 7877) TaxID=425264 RepID=A0A3G2SAL8_MALR7|nr:Cathepsin D [Malassezia restricta CBS 7877]